MQCLSFFCHLYHCKRLPTLLICRPLMSDYLLARVSLSILSVVIIFQYQFVPAVWSISLVEWQSVRLSGPVQQNVNYMLSHIEVVPISSRLNHPHSLNSVPNLVTSCIKTYAYSFQCASERWWPGHIALSYFSVPVVPFCNVEQTERALGGSWGVNSYFPATGFLLQTPLLIFSVFVHKLESSVNFGQSVHPSICTHVWD